MGLAPFVDRVVANVCGAPVDISSLAPECIPGDLFSGATGVAFFLLEIARLRGRAELLPRARRWWSLANAWAASATADDWGGHPDGFIVGAPGISYVDALLSASESDVGRALEALAQIDRTTNRVMPGTRRATELLGGTAGISCLARDLEARLPRSAEYDAARPLLARISDRAIASLRDAHSASIEDESALGAAHGAAGELWVLHSALLPNEPATWPRLSELSSLRRIDDEGLVFWLSAGRDSNLDMVSSWCNGLAGHGMLWIDVAAKTLAPEHNELARAIVDSIIAIPERVPGLCCGLAGQALVIQRFADLSGERRFARRAYERLVRATTYVEAQHEQRLSLWQGALGVALLAEYRLRGSGARFPLLEPP